jgi:hypothetical protein
MNTFETVAWSTDDGVRIHVGGFYRSNLNSRIFRKSGVTNFLLLGLAFFLPLAGCKTASEEEIVILKSSEQRDRLVMAMDSLKALNDSIWQEVTKTMEMELPPDLPPDERRNMLQLKNADLIQMFQVFDSLDIRIQNKVMEAGKMDQELAAQMRQIMLDIEAENRTIALNMATLEKKDSSRASELRSKIQNHALN